MRSSTIDDSPGMLGRAGAEAGACGMASHVITLMRPVMTIRPTTRQLAIGGDGGGGDDERG